MCQFVVDLPIEPRERDVWQVNLWLLSVLLLGYCFGSPSVGHACGRELRQQYLANFKGTCPKLMALGVCVRLGLALPYTKFHEILSTDAGVVPCFVSLRDRLIACLTGLLQASLFLKWCFRDRVLQLTGFELVYE